MDFVVNMLAESWRLLLESSIYIIFGLLIGGLLKVFLNPGFVARHLGGGKFKSVFKAAMLGVPIPLCSCAALPAAASLKRQGANNGALTAFLISTPESGVDSMAVTYALMDPVMTLARPVSAFVTASAAGVIENFFGGANSRRQVDPDLSCTIDGCCDGVDCEPEQHNGHHTFWEKLRAGLRYAGVTLWGDIAAWFLMGLILAGVITALVPREMMTALLGGGLGSMLIMLVVGVPMYICATASTPVAAALILGGASPGAALVFLLVGPATNVTSLTVLLGLLGKRATAIYLVVLSVMAVLCGLAVDWVYFLLNIEAAVVAGNAGEFIPGWLKVCGVVLLAGLSIRPLWTAAKRVLPKRGRPAEACGCSDGSCGQSAEMFPMAGPK